MGIKNLNKFLRGKCPEVFEDINLADLAYLKGAVDVSLYVFKYKTIFGDSWLNAFLSMLMCIRRNDIHVCFIYDTSAPIEKNEERERRKDQREKLDTKIMDLSLALDKAKLTGEIDPILVQFNESLTAKKQKSLLRPSQKKPLDIEVIEYEITRKQNQTVTIGKEDFDGSKKLLDMVGIPWFDAVAEAETTCSDLCIRNKVDVVISEDTDVLCYGAPLFVTKINTTDNTAVLVRYEKILDKLGLTSHQFTDFCIMCGTDYNKNILRIGPEKAYKLIKEFQDIDGIAERSGIDVTILNHVRVREIFKKYEHKDVNVLYCKQPNIKELVDFIIVNNIKTNIERVKKTFDSKEFEIIDE
jgi:5'-3' exonuclease